MQEFLYFKTMTDYIIVGLGLAGVAFCEQLQQKGKSFIVINQNESASVVSAGLYNPVITKRYTLAWHADIQIQSAIPFYQELEKKLDVNLLYPLPVYRLFHSVAEQNQWFEASDKPQLQKYLSDKLITNPFYQVNAPLGFGEIRLSGRMDVKSLVKSYKEFLKTENLIIEEEFNFDALQVSEQIQYKNYFAKKIVFAEGFGIKQNPFFNKLPLVGNKGELLLLHVPDWNVNAIIKSDIFIVPIQNHFYLIGTTYDFDDKTTLPTETAKKQLLSTFKDIYSGDFEVVEHTAGIRPTVIDRRPLIGVHPRFTNIAVLNGLGTRGVMLAPYLAKMLFSFLEEQIPIHPEADIKRFKKIEW